MKALLNMFLVFFPLFVFASQNDSDSLGTISGAVFTVDGQPAAYVTVLIKNTNRGCVTDAEGKFGMKKMKTGRYILSVSLSGYTPTEVNVEVKQNETLPLRIQLQVTYAELLEVTVKANAGSRYVESRTSEGLRVNLPLNEIPQNITVVTRQLLADQGLLSMSESIRNVSGIVKPYGGLNDYSLIIRGTDAAWNVFRNGMNGYFWNQQEDAAMIEKIEFIKGPAGYMNSLAQPGGFVNIVTKQPTKERIANINASLGSYNLMRLSTDFGGALSKRGKLSCRFNTGIHNQQRAFQFSRASRYFVCAAMRYEPGTNTSITAEYNYMWGRTSGNNDGLPSLEGKMFALARNFAVADVHTDRLTVFDKFYRIQLKHNFSDNWRLNAEVAYAHGAWGGYRLWAGGDIPVSNDTLYRISSFDDWRNFSSVAKAFIDGKFHTGHKIEHKILFGIDNCNGGVRGTYGDTGGEPKYGLYIPQPQYYIDPDSLKNFAIDPPTKLGFGWTALYLQDHVKIAGKLVVTIASHLIHFFLNLEDPNTPDYEKHTTNNIVTPRAGLTWLFSDNLSVYALYDQSFWPQTAKNFEHKPFLPLTGFDVETGMKSYFFNKKLGMNLSVYHIVKNNTLAADPLHIDYFIERGQIISNGIDFDITGNITNAFTVNANYEYADAKITKDSDPNIVGLKNFGTPDHYGNIWLKYNLLKGLLKNISFAVGYQHMGKRGAEWNWVPGDEIKFLLVYNLLDAAISYRNEKFNVGLNVYNITNINYATLGYFNSSTNEWRYTPGEPVNFRLGVGVNLIGHKRGK
jgi:iron complex outermembrane receptor protein